jgi:hypothetical protein
MSPRGRAAPPLPTCWSAGASEGAGMVEGATKSGKPRVVDLDPATVQVFEDRFNLGFRPMRWR